MTLNILTVSAWGKGMGNLRSTSIGGWMLGGAALLVLLGISYFMDSAGAFVTRTLLPVAGGLALMVGLVLTVIGLRLIRAAQVHSRSTQLAILRRIQETPRKLAAHSERSEKAATERHAAWPIQPTASLFNYAAHLSDDLPEMLSRYIALGRAHYARNDKPKAADMLHRAITLYPEHKEGYRELAAFYVREGALERAMEYVAQAIQVDPSARRDFLEDPLFDALRDAEQTHDWFERLLSPS